MTINGRTNFVIDQKHGHFRAYDQLAIDPDSCSGRGPKRNARPVKLLINEELKASMLLRNIWGVKPNKKDAMDLAKFTSVFREVYLGKSTSQISTKFSIPYTTVQRWRSDSVPNIINTFKSAIDLGRPKLGWKWLPLNLGTHGELKGPVIQVVDNVGNVQEVRDILGQLKPLKTLYERAPRFGLNGDHIASMKTCLFFYLLGVMVGGRFQNETEP